MFGFSPVSELIQASVVPERTETFLRSVESGTLTATLYSLPHDRHLLDNAGRVVLNIGNGPYTSKIEEFITSSYLKGQDIRTYSHPADERRLHAKTYTGEINNVPTAYISTANLSETAFRAVPPTKEERIRQYTGGVFQENLAFQTNDPFLVEQISRFQSEVSENRIPTSTQNVAVGGTATQVIAQRIAQTKQGDRVILSGPYIDDPYIVSSLLAAKAQGAEVTVISANPKTQYKGASSNTGFHAQAITQLAASGVEVLTPATDDPLLIHTKAVAIVGQSGSAESLFAIGSHNLTKAAKENRSVDLMLLLNDPNLAKSLYKTLSNTQGLQPFETNFTEFVSPIELRMTLEGREGLYRVLASGNYGPGLMMPYYPTRMDKAFFKYLNDKNIPFTDFNIYSNLYISRTGKSEVPTAIKQLDKELSDPGLGYTLNRLIGHSFYEPGFGLIGSAIKSIGKFVDWTLGFDAHKQREEERRREHVGGMRKYFAAAYEDTYSKEHQGPFEQIFSNFYQIGVGVAATLSFYVGLELPLKYMKAVLETDYVKMLFQLPSESPKNWLAKGALKLSTGVRTVVFGPVIGHVLSSVINNPETTPENFMDRLYDRMYKRENVLKDPMRRALTREGNFTTIQLGDEGLLGLSRLVRGIDKVRFQQLTAPILEAINPYSLDSTYYSTYKNALSELAETVGKPATITFESRVDNSRIYQPVLQNFGAERVREIAKRYDDIASLLPANLMYWVPPLRRLLNLPEFDPSEQMTVRDIISFEDAIHWTDHFYRHARSILQNPLQNVRQITKAWVKEAELIHSERQLVKELSRQFSPAKFHLTQTDDLRSLHQYAQEVFEETSQQIQAVLSDQRVANYSKQLEAQRKLLEQSPFRLLSETAVVTESKYKVFESSAQQKIFSLRRFVSRVGVALLADRVADQFIFQPLGANLFTQIRAHQELTTAEGQIARFQFTGDLPKELVVTTQLATSLAVGFLLPNVVDQGNYPGSFSTVLDPLRGFQKQLKRAEREIYKAATEEVLETAESHAVRQAFSNASKRYQNLQSEIQSLKYRRIGLKFNTTAAIAGGLLAGFGLKTLAIGAAALLNLMHNNAPGFSVPGMNAYLSSTFERLTKEGMQTATTREDYANLAIGQALAQRFLNSGGFKQTIYSIATQLTSPFIQIPFLFKADPTSGKATLSVGLQLMPLLGSGITPALPIAFKLDKDSIDGYDFIASKLPGVLTPFQMAGVMARGLLSTLTFSNTLVYEKDSAYEKGLDFIGLSTALLISSERLSQMNLRARLASRFGEQHSLIKQFDDIEQHTRALRAVASGALEFSNKTLRFVYSLPVALASSTVQAVAPIINSKLQHFKLPPALRRIAPYYFSFVMANVLADPEGGYAGAAFKDPWTRVSGVLSAGLVTGAVLDYTGVFADVNDLANQFQSRTRNLSSQAYRQLVRDWLPNVKNGTPTSELLDQLVENLRNAPASTVGAKSLIPRRLLSTMAAPALWQQAHRIAEINFMQQPTTGTLDDLVKLDLPYQHIKSLGGKIASAALGLFALRTTAYALTSVLPELPIITPALRLISGADAQETKAPDVGYRILNRVVRTLSFGLFELPKASGLYSDTTDPFLNLIGPVGASFKTHRTNYYVQYATSFSDFSTTSYDFVRGGFSPDLIAQVQALMQSGQATNLNQALAQIRGIAPRKKPAIYEAITSYEMDAVQSAGISRALSIRQFRLQHAANQRASELQLDFLKEAYLFGELGHHILPGYQMPYNGYKPFSFLSGTDILFQKSIVTEGELAHRDPYKAFVDWFQNSQWKSRRVTEPPNPFKVFSTPNLPWLGASLTVLMGLGALSTTTEIIAKLSTHVLRSEVDKLTEASKLSQGKLLTSPYRYVFTTGNLPGSGRSTVFQLDKLNRYSNVHRLPIDLDEFVKGSAFDLVTGISKAYQSLHLRVNKYFTGSYLHQVQNLLTQLEQASDVDRTQLIKAFKSSVQSDVSKIVRQQMQRVILKGSSLTFYQAFYGGTNRSTPASIRQYIDESKFLLNRALDEVLDEISQFSDLSSQTRHLQLLKLNARFEQSEGLQRFLARLSEPIRGSYDIRAERRAWMRWVDQELNGSQTIPQGRIQRSVKTWSFTQPTIEPWTEGFLTTTLKALKGASMLTGAWVATGRSVYELFESAAVLLAGNSQPASMRLAAGEQMASGALYWGISSAIAGVASMVGLGPLGAIALGIGSLLGLDYLKSVSTPVRQLEQRLIRSVGQFLAHPVHALAKIGLGSVAEMIATPLSMIASAVTAPVRFLLENFAAPFLQEQNLGLPTDSLPIQVIKSLLLPRSVYAQFEAYEPRSSTLAGREPFIGGNIAYHLKRHQAFKIQSAISAHPSIDETTVHPAVLGRSSGFTYERYFDSPQGTRVLQPFGPNQYRISNSMRLALQRRQAMYDASVTAAAISRPPEPPNFSVFSLLHASGATLFKLQLADLQQSVTTTLKSQISDSIDYLAHGYHKLSAALWQPVESLLNSTHQLQQRATFLLKSLKPQSNFRVPFSLPKLKIQLPQLNFQLPKLSIQIPKLQFHLPQLEVPIPSLENVPFNRFLDFEKLTSNIRLPSFPSFKLPKIDFAQVSQFASEFYSSAKFLATSFAGFVENAVFWVHRADTRLFGELPDLSGFPKFLNPLEQAIKRASQTVKAAMPRVGYVLSDLLGSLPRGFASGAFWGGFDFLTGLVADTRLQSLDPSDSFKEFQRAYQEVGASFAGFTLGGFVASLTGNPLLSVGASILGGILGLQIGDVLARSAYQDQEQPSVLGYLQQSLITAGATTLIQLPSLAKKGSLAKTALLNIGLSLVTGGLGPVTQLSSVHGLSNFVQSFWQHPGKAAAWKQRLQMLGQDLQETVHFWRTGKVSDPYYRAATAYGRTLLNELDKEALRPVRFRTSGSHLSIEGRYYSKYRSIHLSASTYRTLGRHALGRRVRATDLAEARFTLLHEAAHALDDVILRSHLDLEDLDRFIYQHPLTSSQVSEIENLLVRSSQASAVSLYEKYSGQVNARFLERVYKDELSANVRALQEFIKRYPEQVSDLLKVLRRTSDTDITERYQSILTLTEDIAEFTDPGVRYRRSSHSLFRREQAIFRDLITSPKRFIQGFFAHQPGDPPVSLRFATQTPNMSSWNRAVHTFNADFSDVPGPIATVLKGAAKGIGSYQMVRSGSDVFALYLRNALLQTLSAFDPVYTQGYRVHSRLAAGGLNVVSLVDSIFIGVDLFQGVQSNLEYAALNRKLRKHPGEISTFKQEITKLRNSQLGGILGATFGAMAGFISKNPVYGLILGGVAGLLAPFTNFFGLSTSLGEEDLAAASQGHALYDPMQSPAYYVRVNKQMLAEKEATIRLLKPMRTAVKRFSSRSLNVAGRIGSKALKFGYQTLSHLVAVGVSATTTAATLLGSTLTLSASLVTGSLKGLLRLGLQAASLTKYPLRQLATVARKGLSLLNRTSAYVFRQAGYIGRFSQQIYSITTELAKRTWQLTAKAETALARTFATIQQYIPNITYWSDDLVLPTLKMVGKVTLQTGRVVLGVSHALARSSFSLIKSAGKATTQTMRLATRIVKPLLRSVAEGLQAGLLTAFELSKPFTTLGYSLLRFSVGTAYQFGRQTAAFVGRTVFFTGKAALSGVYQLSQAAFATASIFAKPTTTLIRSIGRVLTTSASVVGRATSVLGRVALTSASVLGRASALLLKQTTLLTASVVGRAASIVGKVGFGLGRIGYRLGRSFVSSIGLELRRIGGRIATELSEVAQVLPAFFRTRKGFLRRIAPVIGDAFKIGATVARVTAKGLWKGSKLIGSTIQATTHLVKPLAQFTGSALSKSALFAIKAAGEVIQATGKFALSLLNAVRVPTKLLSGLQDLGAFAAWKMRQTVRSFARTSRAFLGLIKNTSAFVRQTGILIGQTGRFLFDFSAQTMGAAFGIGRNVFQRVGQFTSVVARTATAAAQIAGFAIHTSTRLLTSATRTVGRLFGSFGRVITQVADQGVRQVARYTPGIARTILAQGYKETILNALSPVLDITTMAGGVWKASQLNAYSSLSEVEEAYIQAGAGRGSLVGSVFGTFAIGGLGDVVGSLVGQFIGIEAAKKRARLRYEARDYGVMPILEDFIQPVLRENVLAAHAGTFIAKRGQALTTSFIERSLSNIASGRSTRLSKAIVAASSAYRRAFRTQVAQATSRFTRVLGRAPGAASVGRFVSGTSKIVSSTSGKILKVIGPAIDLSRIGVGFAQSQTARTEAEYQVSIRRTSGGLGSLAGGLIGGAFGGPIGAIVGSLVGDFVLDKVGEHLAQEAYMRNVSAKTVTTGQITGGVVGAGVGLLAGGLLIGAGLVAATLALPVLLAAAGVGLLAGAIAGGYATLTGKQKDISKTAYVKTAQRRRATWDERQAQERLVTTQLYLGSMQPTRLERQLSKEQTSTKTREQNQQRQWWSGIYDSVVAVGRKTTEVLEGIQSYLKRTHEEFQAKVETIKTNLLRATRKAEPKQELSTAKASSATASASTTQTEASTTQTETRPTIAASVKGGVKLSEAEAYRLAALAIMEAPTRMGRLDVVQAVFNRMNAPKVGAGFYGKSVTSILFAPGQFEPYFGVSASEVKNRADAVSILRRKRGMSATQANQLLDQFFKDVADPTKMSQARQHVGGRTDFKGTTMYGNMVKGEDKLRTYGENFFHIGHGQSYKQLKQLEQLGPAAIVKEGQALPEPTTTASSSTTQSLVGKLSGSVVPFRGVIVTSAVDASGEPGLDYVVESGRRGAKFGSLTTGQVIEVVANQNWESHLERGDTRRGYGNRVIVRTKDPKTGEFVDLLYAHLDKVYVKKGQTVGIGTVLGTQGRTGSTTGAHVSVDFFAKDANYASKAALAMRDRLARELSRGAPTLNKQAKQTVSQITMQTTQTTQTTHKTESNPEQTPPADEPKLNTVDTQPKQKRLRRNLQSNLVQPAADVKALNHAAVSSPSQLKTAEKMFAVLSNIVQKANQASEKQTKLVKVSTSKIPQAVASMDSANQPRKNDTMQATVAGSSIEINSITGYLRDWVSVTGLSAPLEFAG